MRSQPGCGPQGQQPSQQPSGKSGLLCNPIAVKGALEPMHRRAMAIQASAQRDQQHHPAERAQTVSGREDYVAVAHVLHRQDQLYGSARKWDAVFAAGFHPFSGNSPRLAIKIHFAPASAYHFPGSCCGENSKFKRPRGGRRPSARRSPINFGNSSKASGGVVFDLGHIGLTRQKLIEVAFPTGWIVALPKPPHFGPVQDRLDSLPHAPCCDRLYEPDRLEGFYDTRGVYRVYGQRCRTQGAYRWPGELRHGERLGLRHPDLLAAM